LPVSRPDAGSPDETPSVFDLPVGGESLALARQHCRDGRSRWCCVAQVLDALVHRDYTIAGPTLVFVLSGTGIRRITRLLRQANGASLGIAISAAEVVLTLPRGPATLGAPSR
jgi:hypothetical protein